MKKFFQLILDENVEAVKAEINEYPDILTKTNEKSNLTPFFFAIKNNKLKIVEAISEISPQVLNQKIKEMTPFFFALQQNKVDIVDFLIKENAKILESRDAINQSPLFFVATHINPTKLRNNNFYDCFSCFRGSPSKKDEDLEDRLKILQIIAKNQFGRELKSKEINNLVKLIHNTSLLKFFFHQDGEGFRDRKIIKELLSPALTEIQKQSTSIEAEFLTKKDFELYKKFLSIYQQILREDQPTLSYVEKDNAKKLKIYDSLLDGHSSYFIFHVDNENLLSAISYCDGNKAYRDRFNLDSNYINGISTYKLRKPEIFSEEFAKSFVRKTCKSGNLIEFYTKIISGESFPLDTFHEPTLNITLKKQQRGSCMLKNLNILARGSLEFLSESILFCSTTSGSIGSGQICYKKFKSEIVKYLSQKIIDYSGEFKQEFLSRLEISDIFDDIVTNSSKKTNTRIPEDCAQKIREIFSIPSQAVAGPKPFSLTSTLVIVESNRA
jgi:hypothetical protein